MHNKIYLGMAATVLLAGIAGGTAYGVNEVNKLNDKYNSQTEEISVLQEEVDTLTADKTALQEQLTSKTSQIETLNSRIEQLVAQAGENDEFQFGTYVSSVLCDDDARFENGYYDDTFAQINDDGTGSMFFYDEFGEVSHEPFTYRQVNDKVIVEFEDPETHEIVESYELTLSNGYFDLVVDEGDEPVRFVYCSEELHDAILARHNLRWQVVGLSNELASLEQQSQGNQASYSVTRRQFANIFLGGFGFGANIQSSNDNTITTEEQGFSGLLGDTSLGMFGTWNSADYALTQNNIGIDDIDCYSFDIDGNIITTESTANHVDYSTDNNVEIETHLYVNGHEVMTAEDMNDIAFMYAESNLSIQFTLNENQMITSLNVSCYVTGEITPISEEQEGPVQETQYSLQYGVIYDDGNGNAPLRFANDGTFEFITAPAPTAGTYVGVDTNYYSLEVNGNDEGSIHLLSDSSLEYNGSVYTAVQQQVTVYSLQTDVYYEYMTDTFYFNNDGTFEYVTAPAPATGTYSSDGSNTITLVFDDGRPSQQFVLTDNNSFDYYGTTFTVSTPAPGGDN